MVRRLGLVASLCAVLATATFAAGLKPPEWNVQLQAVSSSNLFPGYVQTAPDRGLEGQVGAETNLRIANALKLGLEGQVGGQAYARFPEARDAWLEGAVSARHGGSQLNLEGEWTPRRVKMTEARDAVFMRLGWRLGVRQALPRNLRLRAEYRFHQDDYIPASDARDARAHGAYGQLAWRPNPALTIAYQVEVERTDAAWDRFSNDDHVVAGSVSWRGAVWQLGGAVRSGVSRYRSAQSTDANFWRRDQWIEASPSVGRRLSPALRLVLGATVMNQISTRLDRTFDVHSFRLGLEWNTAGE